MGNPNRDDEVQSNKSFQFSIWKRLFPFAKPYKKLLLLIVITNILISIVDVSLPLFQRYAVDNFIEKGTLDGLPVFIAAYLAVIILQVLSFVFYTLSAMKTEMRMGRDLKRACFVHLQTLSFSYYNTTPVGYILARVMSDTNKIAAITAWDLIDILWALSYVSFAFLSMAMLDLRLALMVMVIVPVIAVLTTYFQKRILFWNRKVRSINSRITGAFNEGIMGAKTSKTLVIEDKNTHEFSELTEEMRNASVRAAGLNALYIPLVMLASSAATAIVLARGGNLVLEHGILIGTLSAFTTYAVSIFEPIQQMARVLANIIAVQPNIERVMGLLDQKPNIVDTPEVIEKYGDSFHPKTENWEPIKGDIEFDDVSFRYPDGEEEVLSHFSLKIPAGTNVAIVGETGAGKSTLVNLACRFFEPTGGRILIDGKDYRERSQLWLHSRLGYVLQNPHLFSGTVMDNIRYGRLDATDEEVKQAAKAVSADTVVEHLENGYDSDVGEGGDKLSTGEKQLISFARAVLADPAIFVLDEATSSIDTQTEQLIQNATMHLLEGRTSFLIAHRLSTIRQADLILVVKDGKIVEQGKHEELLRKGGYYHDLYSKQFQEEEMSSKLNS
ncbi:ABC transporter ATP-binding protein [Negativibacillus massiliensis]|uniref:ABC transporter ATP-binding protein n=1 Tax=Negativibacillus massiliensis TaxID=1871035 RepID=UPI0023F14E95|nr:ABC transporter ATP-binding protein [Negativibacillus massiliensis]MCI6349279.1 ABC transporter ATP-binding protein/permease [Negativibacillus massiliensis]MDY4046834.1 ABC transporter ATP-binding protein [Negativibacillus massiliensis]